MDYRQDIDLAGYKPGAAPDFETLSRKISDAIEFCHLLQVRLDNMHDHGTPGATIYSFKTGQKIDW